MKKHIATLLLLLCFVLSLGFPALAEPRYPSQTGETTDAAAVLSHTTLEDLRTLDSRLDQADAMQLKIVTVDFLDAAEADDYAAALFDRWGLDDHEMLLLLAVGEDKYALEAGQNVDRLLSPATQSKLLAASFEEPFLNQQYDAAIAAFVPSLVREINKLCGTSVSTDDLFGRSSASLFDNWASSLRQNSGDADESDASIFTREDSRTGFSLLKVILIIAVLMFVFGSFRRIGSSQRNAKPPRGRRPARHPYAENRRTGPRRPRR